MDRIGNGFELLKPELVGVRPRLIAIRRTAQAGGMPAKIRVIRRGALRR